MGLAESQEQNRVEQKRGREVRMGSDLGKLQIPD